MLSTIGNTRALASLFNATLAVLTITFQGCSQPARGSAGDPERPIEISTTGGDTQPLRGARLEVGLLAQRGRLEQSFWLHNSSHVAQRLTGYSSSCECLTINGLPIVVPAGGTAQARLRIDLQREGSFTGELEVVVALEVADGDSIPLKVRFEVEAVSEPAASASDD